jgi:hypothetical protein
MALHYQPAQLHGGPLDGNVVQAPLREDQSIPVRVIGVPVPVLDERTETFWWDTGNYFCAAGANAAPARRAVALPLRPNPGRLSHLYRGRGPIEQLAPADRGGTTR